MKSKEMADSLLLTLLDVSLGTLWMELCLGAKHG